MTAARIESAFPARSTQTSLLLSLFSSSSATSVFCYGPPATGKTDLVRRCLSELALPFVLIDCLDIHSVRILFERVLEAFECDSSTKCENLVDFTDRLKSLRRNDSEPTTTTSKKRKKNQQLDDETSEKMRWVVLDNAERLRHLSPTLLASLTRLGQLADVKVSVVFISRVVWEKFRSGTGMYQPYLVHFPPYQKQDLLKIMGLYVPPIAHFSNYIEENVIVDQETLCVLHKGFVAYLYAALSDVTHSLTEFKFLVALLFPNFIAPVLKGHVAADKPRVLYERLKELLRTVVNLLYLRDVSGIDKVVHQTNQMLQSRTALSGVKTTDVLLPKHAKYLLIASFLASYNPAKFDAKFFTNAQEKKTKRGGRRARAVKQGKSKTSQLLLGPKPFAMDRMLAIYANISSDSSVNSSLDIHFQVSTLCSLKLLTRVTTSVEKTLEGQKCKCNVSLEMIRRVAQSIQFPIESYLADFQNQ